MRAPMIDIEVLLSYGAAYRDVQKGEVIFQEGTEGRYFHQLVKGRVKWLNIDEEGKEFVQKFIVEGESFGELPLLDDGPYVSTAIADEDSRLIRLPKKQFLLMLAENPDIHFSITRLMTQRLRDKFIILKEVAQHDPERKVSAILDLYRKENFDEKGNLKVELTRKEIANMTGLRVETVIRTIRGLQDKGLLDIEHGKVLLKH